MEIGAELPKHFLISHDPSECCDASKKKLAVVPNKQNEGDVGIYGPALPPRNTRKELNSLHEDENVGGLYGPAKSTHNDEVDVVTELDDEDKDGGGLYGPALPPGFKQKSSAIIGPCRPAKPQGLHEDKTDRKSSSDSEDDEDSHAIGPKLPSPNEEDEYLMRRKAEIEFRARVKKDELSDNKEKRSKKIEREEWMTELPPELGKNFGLGPRTFRNKEVNLGDRSVWTDTPSQRERKKNTSQSKSPKRREKSKKEVDMEKYVSEHNKRYRSESLLDVHQKDQKKKKQTDGVTERRPFDREIDLGVRQMDAAKRKSLIKQSTHLNSKFAHSKQGPTYL